eukprot:TRINITY_DN718_c2_g1_i1.p1 TRINITY_DN718_c2_g1~~TRINITY_DN718_c2_g1_i1.p1  ORF type:complete len:613 (+),score=87.56 TRINITY_DN718_c2_g1_i1:2328-4166(+)
MAIRGVEQAGPFLLLDDCDVAMDDAMDSDDERPTTTTTTAVEVPVLSRIIPDHTGDNVLPEGLPPGHPEWPGPPGETSDGRQQWGSSFDYIVVLLGYAIGIGNVWRFPYLAGKHGGGAFLFPYLVCLFAVSAPLFIMELALGQNTRCSTVQCFRRFEPKWVGVALASTAMIFFVCTYYNVLLAYCIIYLQGSFSDPLPWTDAAVDDIQKDVEYTHTSSSAEYYWEAVVLHRLPKSDPSTFGGLEMHLVLALGIIWMLVFLALCNGIQSSSKAAYITVPLPIILLVVMFLRAVTLDGSGAGIDYYTKFEGSKIFKLEVWVAACGQILFSLSPGMGTAITMSSYTKPGEDVYKVGIIIAVCNSTFSILAGFVVFALLGHMSHNSGVPVETLAEKNGAGLAFVALAQGISTLPSPNFFSALFFIMLLCLGLDSTFAWVETFNAVVDDYITERCSRGKLIPGRLGEYFPDDWRPTKAQLAGTSALLLYLVSLPYCTRGGFYLLDVVDHYCATYVLLAVCALEVVIVKYHFGFDRLVRHINLAGNRNISVLWTYCWEWIAPGVCTLLFFSVVIGDFISTYEDYKPAYIVIGNLSAWLPLLLIPGYMAIRAFVKWRKR